MLGQLPDEQFQPLLAGAQRGEERSFAALWRAFNPGLVRFLSGSADREDALDLASTVWLDVVRGLDRFAGDASGFRAWLFTIARHRVVDLRRAEGRRPQFARQDHPEHQHERADDVAADPSATVEAEWSTDEAIALIATLPSDQADVLLLRIVADLDVTTVASIVGKRPGTVRVLSHRGLRRLAQLLEADLIVDRNVTP